MIRFTLKCDNDHSFESWFQSGDAYDGLMARNLVSCPDCGNTKVAKSLMAPQVRPARNVAPPPPAPAAPVAEPKSALSAPQNDRERALAQVRDHVEKNSDYVGMNFAAEARKMHDGDTPERAIYGEAKIADAKALIEDGVPVAPLPFRPARKVN